MSPKMSFITSRKRSVHPQWVNYAIFEVTNTDMSRFKELSVSTVLADKMKLVSCGMFYPS